MKADQDVLEKMIITLPHFDLGERDIYDDPWARAAASGPDYLPYVKPRTGIVSRMLAARKARRKPSLSDTAIHSAIAAMQRPTRAHEL